MAKISTLRNLADDIIVLLERKNTRMNVNVLEGLSNVDHKKFKLVLDFLIEFKIIEYNPRSQTVKLSNSLLLNQSNQELSSERVGYKLYKTSKKQEETFSGNIDYNGISFGYVLDGETVQDLQ